mgnify:CR=1 FL=1
MDRKKFLKTLIELLHSFSVHSALLTELLEELKHSGNEVSFITILEARLKFLNEHGIEATVHKEFENIEKGIYSMHLSGNGFNMRILYGFIDGAPALLYAFHERGGHGRTDYTGKVDVALQRLTELKEDR